MNLECFISCSHISVKEAYVIEIAVQTSQAPKDLGKHRYKDSI